jgi:hypothetical protein
LDSTHSDEGAQDNTLSTVNHASSEGGGVPTMKVDPPRLTSIQAVLDNYCGDPNFTTDPTLSCIWESASESSKVLDSAIHSFHQEQTKHDQWVHVIIQDLRADRIDPESFVSTQDFDARVRTTVQEAVDPFHKTLHKELDAIKHLYNAILTNFGKMMTSGNTILISHKKRLAKHQACLDQAAANSVAIQLALAQLGTSVSTHLETLNTTSMSVVSSLDKVSTMNASVVSHVARLTSDISSFNTRLTTIESTIAQVAMMTDLVSAHLQDMGASLTSWLSLLDSNMTSLAQHSKPSPTFQNPLLVMPNPSSTDGSHNVADSNKDTNGTTAGPHGDIDDAAGTILPPQQVTWCAMVIRLPHATQSLVQRGPLLLHL